MKCKRKKNYWQQDIHKIEYFKALLQGVLLIGLVSYLFYGTWVCTILFLPYLFWYIKSWEKQLIKKKKLRFRLQFKDGIQSLSSALNVGYSLENAMQEAVKDLRGIYKKDDKIMREFLYMIRQMKMNIPVETTWNQFAERTKDEDVSTFVAVFNMAKRSGGDALGIIRNPVKQMGDKIDVEREIDTIMSAKRAEFKIMSVIPFAMIGYLKLSFPEFLDVLYGNAAGVLVMSICLLVYLVSYEWGKHMVEIEV